MVAYYNENDPYAAQWLRNLIAEGLIAPGDVDERSIEDVTASDVRGYTQKHYFAGLGGWSFALRIAGWSDDRPVTTGSCPCQPFSQAGKQKGFDDPRHLWPHLRRLVAESGTDPLFIEQVASASEWICLVRSDLEAMGRAVGGVPVEAASAGAEHFRDRYWFVADYPSCRADAERSSSELTRPSNLSRSLADRSCGEQRRLRESRSSNEPEELPDRRYGAGSAEIRDSATGDVDSGRPLADRYEPGSLPATQRGVHSEQAGAGPRDVEPQRHGLSSRSLVDAPGLGWGEGWTEPEFRSRGFTATVANIDGCQYLECPDGKWRRLPPPSVLWLGTRIPARIPKLRALGNSIDHRPAVAFIKSYMDVVEAGE